MKVFCYLMEPWNIASKSTLKYSLEKYSTHVKYTNVIIVAHNQILYFLGPSESV